MSTTDAPEEEKDPALPAIDFYSLGRFSVRNPEPEVSSPGSCAPANFKLGEHAHLEHFDLATQAQSHALSLIQQAQQQLCIFTPDLEGFLYSNPAVQEACTRLLLANPRHRLRILLRDAGKAVRQGHRLLNLSKRITSNLHIRRLDPEQCDDERAYLLADDRGLLMRDNPLYFSGYSLYNAASRVRQLQAQFDQAWDSSLSDPDLRSFLL